MSVLVKGWKSVQIPVKEAGLIPKPTLKDGDAYRISYISNGMKRERINYVSRRGEAIVAKDVQPCCVCGEPTNRVDIFYEGRFCSDMCIAEYEKDLFEKGEVL